MEFDYPVFLSLHSLTCLIVGLGGVGQRKLGRLLACNPRKIMIVDKCAKENLPAGVHKILRDPRISFHGREFRSADLEGVSLVFACSDSRELNRMISEKCRQRKIFCNSITDPQNGNFIIPGRSTGANLSVALSTNGGSPALTRHLMRELDDWISDNEKFAAFMAALRPHVLKEGLSAKKRAAIFNSIVRSPLKDMIGRGRFADCKDLILTSFPSNISKIMVRALDDLS